MKVAVGYSMNPDVSEALAEVQRQWGAVTPRVIIYFASTAFPAEALARAWRAAYPEVEQMGCTTAGELVGGKMLTRSLVAMALTDEVVGRVKVELIPDLHAERAGIDAPLASFAKHFGASVRELDGKKFVGLVLVDGLSRVEERLMDALGNASDLLFVGGSAADDMKFERTVVAANGTALSGGAVLALLEMKVPFKVLKTQSFRALPKELVATKVDHAERRVLEFDHRPAVEAYATAVGSTPARIAEQFQRHPLGLMVDGEPYVRSPLRPNMGSLEFFCDIREGTRLSLLESTDIIKDTAAAVKRQEKELGGISALIDFHCSLRFLELTARHLEEDYAKVFEGITMVGFSTYGEQYIGHINQTSTMLVLGT